MKLSNHIIGGVVCTGVFCSLLDINLLAEPSLLVACLVASILPDVDIPSSFIGRILKPFSRLIYDRFGHRTLTHSLVFLIMVFLLCSGANHFLQIDYFPVVFTVAYFVHILLDMMTISGVEFLHPFSKILFVMPGNPSMRIKSSSRSSELSVTAFFLLAGFFLQPLVANGFWTSYNKSFGTIKHLISEFSKSDDVLDAKIKVRSGSVEYELTGKVVDVGSDFVMIHDGFELTKVPDGREIVLDVEFSHTGQSFTYRKIYQDMYIFDEMKADKSRVFLDIQVDDIGMVNAVEFSLIDR